MSFLDKLGGIAKNIGDKTGEMLAVNKLNSKIYAEQQAAAEELRNPVPACRPRERNGR